MSSPATHPDIVGVFAETRDCTALVAPRTPTGDIAATGSAYALPIVGWAVDRLGATHPLVAFGDELGDYDAVRIAGEPSDRVISDTGDTFRSVGAWLDHLRAEQAERKRQIAERTARAAAHDLV